MTIAEYIHNLRLKNDMTLTQFGGLIGVDSGALSKIENGKKFLDRKTLLKISEAFSLDINDLNQEFISEKIALEIIDYSCDESVLKLVEEKIKLLKSKKITQAELNF